MTVSCPGRVAVLGLILVTLLITGWRELPETFTPWVQGRTAALCKTEQPRGLGLCIVTATTDGCDRRHLTRKRPCMPTQKF
jgi:hypothetical protein